MDLTRRDPGSDEVALEYVFDFDDSELVVYTGDSPWPGRVFLLRFWRHAKDGMMALLGYRHQGQWRDPTRCYPGSYVRYYRPNRPAPAGPNGSGHSDVPPDSSSFRRSSPIEQLAYRVPLLELEPGIFELPTLKGRPVEVIANVQVFRRLPRTLQTSVKKPALGIPIQKTIEFVAMSAHFQKPQQAAKALADVIKTLKQFPLLQVTIQGNLAFFAVPKAISGFSAAARADQNALFPTPAVTRWPNETESHASNGQVMDSRARTIQQFLIRSGIAARRVHVARGQYLQKRTVTIIFSN